MVKFRPQTNVFTFVTRTSNYIFEATHYQQLIRLGRTEQLVCNWYLGFFCEKVIFEIRDSAHFGFAW